MPKNKKSNSSHRLHLGKWGTMRGEGRGRKSSNESSVEEEEFSGYDYWCLNVYHQLDRAQIRRDMKDDDCVLSERSKYIIGSRIAES
jgi:hypothetical protein